MTEHKLPDLLAPNLRVVFVGTAAGAYSAKLGAYYAKPGNRFWLALHEAGITPRLFEPQEYPKLFELCVGLTNLCKRDAGMDHVVKPTRDDLLQFEVKLHQYRPRIVAFTGKRPASYWLKTPTRRLRYGRQDRAASDFPDVFVLPSPSGAARSYWNLRRGRRWLTGFDVARELRELARPRSTPPHRPIPAMMNCC